MVKFILKNIAIMCINVLACPVGLMFRCGILDDFLTHADMSNSLKDLPVTWA